MFLMLLLHGAIYSPFICVLTVTSSEDLLKKVKSSGANQLANDKLGEPVSICRKCVWFTQLIRETCWHRFLLHVQ